MLLPEDAHGPLFITGTDTGIGKTVVAAMVRHCWQRRGRDVAYMKPVQTGCEFRDGAWIAPDPDWVARVTGPCSVAAVADAVCPYALRLPASPHLAAAEEKATIEPGRILAAYQQLAAAHETVLVEGAGGVWVPLTAQETMRDLMVALGLPVLVVARAGLGTLNHTLLTLESLRSVGLIVAGCVLVQTTPGPWGAIESDNITTIERWGQTTIWACIPYTPELADNEWGEAAFKVWVDAGNWLSS